MVKNSTLNKRIIMSGENLIDAQPSIQNQNNEPTVSFTLDIWVHKNLGEQLQIMLEKD